MSGKHTPGPWAVTHEDAKNTIFGIAGPVGNGEATFIAKIPRPHIGVAQAESNARIIAAAPDLLANLQFAVTLLSAMPLISGTAQVEAMRAAIAKATGEPS